MSISDCEECRKLLDAATLAISRYLAASARLLSAMRSEDADTDIGALRRDVQESGVREQDAVQRYENHLISHETKVMAAGRAAE